MLTLYHQFDSLLPELFNQFQSLILATEIRIVLSCLEDTHLILQNQLLGSNQSIPIHKEDSSDSPSSPSSVFNEDQSSLSSLLALLYTQSRSSSSLFLILSLSSH